MAVNRERRQGMMTNTNYTLTDAYYDHHLFVTKMVHTLANRHVDHDNIIGTVWERATRWWHSAHITGIVEARNYLARVIRTVLATDWYYNHRRKRSAELVPIETFDGCVEDSMFEQVVAQHLAILVQQATKKLDKKYSDVLYCQALGLNNVEGAARLGIPRSTYGQRLQRARQYLEEALRDEG